MYVQILLRQVQKPNPARFRSVEEVLLLVIDNNHQVQVASYLIIG